MPVSLQLHMLSALHYERKQSPSTYLGETCQLLLSTTKKSSILSKTHNCLLRSIFQLPSPSFLDTGLANGSLFSHAVENTLKLGTYWLFTTLKNLS